MSDLKGSLHFVGGTKDADTGLTHLGAREYDPAIGRFISVDPIMDLTDPQQINGYTYANNNPVTNADPTGLRLANFNECGPGAKEHSGTFTDEVDGQPTNSRATSSDTGSDAAGSGNKPVGKKTYNWLQSELHYKSGVDSAKMTDHQFRAWIGSLKGSKRDLAVEFDVCMNSKKSAASCMKAAKNKVAEEEDDGGLGDTAKTTVGVATAAGAAWLGACEFGTAFVGTPFCGATALAVVGIGVAIGGAMLTYDSCATRDWGGVSEVSWEWPLVLGGSSSRGQSRLPGTELSPVGMPRVEFARLSEVQ